MISASYVHITRHNLTATHILYKTDDATNLVVIFPGGGNSCDRPVLDFLRKYYLDHQTDVLCISYAKTYLKDDDQEVLMEKITDAINEAITEVQELNKYEKTYYICNSFGNIVSNAIKMKYPDKNAKSAYISPTIDGLNYISNYPGLIISGTKDEYLDEPTAKELQSRSRENLLILEGAAHSLMVDDVFESIDILKIVVKRIIDYLR